jgi:hypothetical protein
LDAVSLQQFLLQSHLFIDSNDQFIDSSGAAWVLAEDASLRHSGSYWTVAQLTLRVQQHYAAQANCCIAKIAAPDIPSLVQLVASSAPE